MTGGAAPAGGAQPVLLRGGSNDPRLAAAAALRGRVFVGEQRVDPAVEADERDREASTTHAVLEVDGAVLATGRLVDPGGARAIGRVGRLAVAPQARGSGLGLSVLRALEAASRDRGLLGVDLHAQAHASRFYARAGYDVVGEAFVEQGIDHVGMRREWVPALRPVRAADAAAVRVLIGGCFAEHPGCVLDLADLDRWMLAPAAPSSGRTLWVVPGEGTALGACVGVGTGGAADELKSLYVAASARRSGWGTVLVRLAERAGARQLWTDTRFTDAHRLYARLGWCDTGERRELHDPSATIEARWVR